MARYLYLKWGDIVVTLTKVEISWIIGLLNEEANSHRKTADDETAPSLVRECANLWAENFNATKEKLCKSLNENHKRIAIR